jgi:hypothetical protein
MTKPLSFYQSIYKPLKATLFQSNLDISNIILSIFSTFKNLNLEKYKNVKYL